jgi:alpha-ketoglutarate-dependent taurine dioxygenase
MQALSAEGVQLERAAAVGPQITGFDETADPLAAQRAEIERRFTERSLTSLRGELPDDPALLRDIETQRQTLDEVFAKRLGPGAGVRSGPPRRAATNRL